MNTWNENHQWHFDYIRLAWDTSFNFDKQKTLNLDKSKICLIDVDRIIDQRDFAAVERCMPTVIQYTLEAEQAAVLDENFVKIFRMGQLTVQYLLFCKKYLDNTVVLLKSELSKFKEENKELKAFNDELKDHVATLVRKLKLQKNQAAASPIHKCEKCMKVFSSNQFLTAHMKRRHPTSDNDDSTVNSEANKLQTEIKMLKERLNSTERLIQQEQKPPNEPIQVKDKESDARLMELQQKFEMWKVQVESELKIVQSQKNAEEKYEKWFENVFEKLKETMEGSGKSKEVKEVDTALQDIQTNDLVVPRRDSVTQTENLIMPVISEEATITALPLNVEETTMTVINFEEGKKHFDADVLPIIKEEITRFEEVVNSKVTGSFQKLENQLDSFWTKLNYIEEITRTPVHLAAIPDKNVSNKDIQIEPAPVESKVTQYQPLSMENKDVQCQPVVKPRTKYQKRNPELGRKDSVLRTELNHKQATSIQMIDKSEYKDEESSDERTFEIEDQRTSKIKGVGVRSVSEGNFQNAKSPQRQSRRNLLLGKNRSEASNKREDHVIRDFKKGLSPKRSKDGSKQASSGTSLKKLFSGTNASNTGSSQMVAVSSDSDSETESSSKTESDSTHKAIKPDLTVRSPKKQIHRQQAARLPLKTKSSRIRTQPPLPEHLSIYHVRETVIESVEDRLQIMGVSPEWKTLPERSFKKAMEIVNHHAALSEKNISNYQHIRKHILQKVAKLLKKRSPSSYIMKSSRQPSTPEKKGIQVKKGRGTMDKVLKETSLPITVGPSPTHHITQAPKSKVKLSRMYDSDTSDVSEALDNDKDLTAAQPKMVTAKHIRGYSDVIRELKLKSSEILSSCESSLEEQVVKSSVTDRKTPGGKRDGNVPDEKKQSRKRDVPDEGNQTKGVLKNYPSVGSLTKKKVLFDLDSESTNKPVVHHLKDGGSTTSLGSSVLDGTPGGTIETSDDSKTKKTEQKEIEDLSDFDF